MSREIMPREITKTYHKPSVIVGAASSSNEPVFLGTSLTFLLWTAVAGGLGYYVGAYKPWSGD